VGCRLAEILPVEPAEKQHLLAAEDPVERLLRLAPLLRPGTEEAAPDEAN
jgi:Lon protease-like protein